MNAAQRIMLFRELGKIPNGRRDRARITRELFGEAISWTTFTNSDVDRMKARLLALQKPDDLSAAMNDVIAEADGERRRLVTRIESDMARAGLSEGYVRKITMKWCDRADWRALPIWDGVLKPDGRMRRHDLTNLRDTIANRARVKLGSAKAELGTADAPKPALYRRSRRVTVVPDNIPF